MYSLTFVKSTRKLFISWFSNFMLTNKLNNYDNEFNEFKYCITYIILNTNVYMHIQINLQSRLYKLYFINYKQIFIYCNINQLEDKNVILNM